MREHLRSLDLTPEQSAKLGPIIDATSAKLEAIRVETAERIRGTMEESERQIAPELTDEQKKKLQKIKERHHRMLIHHGFKPPPPDGASPSP
jgi:Spy/CpxP family protein refolding chaperone